MKIVTKTYSMVIATLFIVLLCSSCMGDVKYHNFFTLDKEGWDRDSVKVFEYKTDTLMSLYDIDIDLNYTNDYPYSNLYLFVSAFDSLNVELFSDTLNCILADEYGEWRGSGWAGSYQQRIEYKKEFQFPSAERCKVYVKQGMRDNPVKGIERVGLRITDSRQ